MGRLFAIVLACAVMAACTTTNIKTAANGPGKPAAGSRILLLQPDVELAVLTASGVQEPRADWSGTAQDNLAREVEAQLKTRSHSYKALDPSQAMTGQVGQLLRLHGAVGQSILAFNYSGLVLPTKTGFDWTLGQGAQTLSSEYTSDYALFIRTRGTYASGGRVATAIGMSLLGVSVPLGSQQIFASLVDLKTGQVVWFNFAVAGPNADMREAAGSASLVKALLKDIPL